MFERQGLRGEARAIATVLALATGLTLLAFLPVLQHPTERLVGTEIEGRHHDAYNYSYQLEQPARLYFYTQPVTDWFGRFLATLVGGIAGYNLLVALTFPLTALTTFLLARHLGLESPMATIAALLFAFTPFHLAHAAYHAHIVQLQWLPLYLLALWLALEQWSWRRAALLAVVSSALVLSNFYYAPLALSLTPVILLAIWLLSAPGKRSAVGWNAGRVAVQLVLMGLVGLAGLWILFPEFANRLGRMGFRYEDLQLYSARWWSYLAPPIEHPLLGEFATRFWSGSQLPAGLVEQQLYVGLGPLLLSGVALVGWVADRQMKGTQREVSVVAATSASAWVPVLVILGMASYVASLPPSLESGDWPRASQLLHSFLPMFRAYARVGLGVLLVVALLAAIGSARLLCRSGWRRGVGIALLILSAIEFAPFPPRWHDVLPTKAHRWLADQDEAMQILDCANPTLGEVSVNSLMPHPTAVLGVFSQPPVDGDVPRFWLDEAMFNPVRPVSDCGEPQLAAKLAALGYTHVIVRDDYRLASSEPAAGLEAVRHFADSDVYRVRSAPAKVFTREIEGFWWRGVGTHSVRWMRGEGRWTVVNTTSAPLEVSLDLELMAYHAPRETALLLEGREIARFEVQPRRTTYRFERIELSSGGSLLEFRPVGEMLVPSEVSGSLDSRPMTIAVGRWAWQPDSG